MTPYEAARHYVELAAKDMGEAIRFAHAYENDCASDDDYDAYLGEIDRLMMEN